MITNKSMKETLWFVQKGESVSRFFSGFLSITKTSKVLKQEGSETAQRVLKLFKIIMDLYFFPVFDTEQSLFVFFAAVMSRHMVLSKGHTEFQVI